MSNSEPKDKQNTDKQEKAKEAILQMELFQRAADIKYAQDLDAWEKAAEKARSTGGTTTLTRPVRTTYV